MGPRPRLRVGQGGKPHRCGEGRDRLGLRRRRTAEPEPDFSTKVPGRLFAIDLKTKAKTLITPKPFAKIDGLESDGRGGFIARDWNAGNIAIVPTGVRPPYTTRIKALSRVVSGV